MQHAGDARWRPPPRRPPPPRPAGPSVSTNPAKVPGRVGAPAHAGHHHVGVGPAEQLAALGPGLVAHHPLELAHHVGEGVGTHHRAEAVVGVVHRGHPVAQGLVDRVLQGPAARGDRAHLGPQQLHAEDVQLPGARCRPRPCRPRTPGRAAPRRWRWPPRAGRPRSRRSSGACPSAGSSSAWPTTLLSLCEPVWARSSRFEQHPHPELLGQPAALGHRRGPAAVVAEDARRTRRGMPGRPRPRRRPPPARRQAGTSDSGTNRPPNSPKRPSGPGLPHEPPAVASATAHPPSSRQS